MPERQSGAIRTAARPLVGAAIALLIVLFAQGCVPFLGSGSLRPGTAAPEVAVQFRGESLTLEHLSEHTVLISFWSST